MTATVRYFPQAGRGSEPYVGFANAYPDGSASIARLVGPEISDAMGCGVASYERVRTVWVLPFDEIICVIDGAMIVRAAGQSWQVAPGDVLFFPRAVPVEYDVAGRVTVFYVKYPVQAVVVEA